MSHGYGYRSEQRLRKENQDHHGVFRFDDRLVLVVCDGMGGHVGGRQASAIAVRTIHDHFAAHGATREQLPQAIEAANLAIFEAARRNYRLMGMGTTCVAAIIDGAQAHIAHVGDSRCYLVREGTSRTLTRDHTMVNLFVDAELLSPEDAATHPEGHVLSRCLGIERAVEVEVAPPFALDGQDALLLCSDGIHGVVSDALLASTDWSTPQRSVDAVLEVVAARKGDDNATLVAYHGGATEAPPPLTPPPDLSQLEAAAAEAQVVMDDITGPRPVPNVGAWEPDEDVAVIEEVDELEAEAEALAAERKKQKAAVKTPTRRPLVLGAALASLLLLATGGLAWQLAQPPRPPPGGVASSPSAPRPVATPQAPSLPQPPATPEVAAPPQASAPAATTPRVAEGSAPTAPAEPSTPDAATPDSTEPPAPDATRAAAELARAESPAPRDPAAPSPPDATTSKPARTASGLPILTAPADLALSGNAAPPSALAQVYAQVRGTDPWQLLAATHDPSVVIPYYQLELPDPPRRLPQVTGSYDKAPPRGPRQVEAVRAVREGRCDEAYDLVRDAIADSVDHAGLFRPVWDCWTNAHQQPLATLRADTWSSLRPLLLHLDGISSARAPLAHAAPAPGGLNRRVELLQTSDGNPSLKEVLLDLMGAPSLADKVGVDLLIMANVAAATARDPKPERDAITTWARQLYQTQVAMQGPLGKLLKEHRPDLATRIDALIFEAAGGDTTAAQIARRERITAVPAPVAQAYADATGARSVDEVRAEAAARSNAAARARAAAVTARKAAEEEARKEAERTPGVKIYRLDKSDDRPSLGRE